jgi:4'-phosphopantetheinyl transferase
VAVEVWWAGPDDDALAEHAAIDPAEARRASSFREEVDRRRSAVAAVVVRLALGRRLDTSPALVRVDRTCRHCGAQHGPPRVAGDRLSVSVSHAGAAVVVAVSDRGPVGVDVEPVDGSDPEPLMGVCLAPAERATGVTQAALLERWVAKEAVLKAAGEGLRLPMTGLVLGGPPRWEVRAWDERPGLVGRVRVQPLQGAPYGHVAAVAVLRRRRATVREHPARELLD